MKRVQKTEAFTIIHAPLLIPCRYNPNTDDGSTNNTYILPNNKGQHGWDPPQDKRFELAGFPLYINWWGFLDYQKKTTFNVKHRHNSYFS